jgi:uncharacterized protein (DUF1810 family)
VTKGSETLSRFLMAQNRIPFERVLRELDEGKKTTHWMWFVFPQMQGLGRSETARCYAISSLQEAQAYVAHPILGARLLECSTRLLRTLTDSAEAIFGRLDSQKLQSSMTLFAAAAPDRAEFQRVLNRFF